MPDTKISGLTAGTLDGTELMPLAAGGANESATVQQVAEFANAGYLIRQAAGYTLSNVTTAQKLFNGSTNGAVTLPTGVYLLTGLIYITGMSATSGNGALSLAGTAVLANIKQRVVGFDTSTPTTANTGSTNFATSAAFPAATLTAGTGTVLAAWWSGIFDVTTSGTVIPSFALTTAVATASVNAGSFFRVQRLGDTSLVTAGPWS